MPFAVASAKLSRIGRCLQQVQIGRWLDTVGLILLASQMWHLTRRYKNLGYVLTVSPNFDYE